MDNNPAPPWARTALWQGFEKNSTEGALALPHCRECKTVQYPLREICRNCLHGYFDWISVDPIGEVKSWTRINYSVEPFFNDGAEWFIGMVKLNCNVVVMSHLHELCGRTGCAVKIIPARDRSGRMVFTAVPVGEQYTYSEGLQKLLS